MKPQGTFKPESIELLYAAYAEKHGQPKGYEENAENFSEAYDFARCQRADGSFYGTSGSCRMGKDAGAKQEAPAAPKSPKSGGGDREKLIALRAKQGRLKAGMAANADNRAARAIVGKELDKTNKQIDRLKKKVPQTPQAQALSKAHNEVQSRFNKLGEDLKKAEGKEFYRIQEKMRGLGSTLQRIQRTYQKMAQAGRDV